MSLSKSNKQHICFVAPSVFPMLVNDESAKMAGGAETQQRFIIRALQSRGYAVSVISEDFGQQDDIQVDGIRVIKINRPSSGLPFVRFFHPGLTSVWRAMARANADIYYQRSAGWLTGIAGLFCRHHRRRFVYAVAHDLDVIKSRTREIFDYPMGWRAHFLFQMGLKRADLIVAQSDVQQEACHRWHHRDSVKILSGYSPISPHEPQMEKDAVLWVAALRHWKRPEKFLELAHRLPGIRFRMIGGPAPGEDGVELYRKIEAEARQIPNLEFLGFQPPAVADAHFDRALVFVNTSDNEGFPNTFLQAWARRVPTVSFVDCGARDAAGPIGRVTADLDAMVRSVGELASQESVRFAEGLRCQHHFEQYHSVDAVGEQYDKLFSNLVAGSCQ